MQENVALIKKKQKSFNSSVQNYKKLLKKGDIKIQEKVKPKRKSKPNGGIVYLGNIPHGFYEDQMGKYFSQFGHVTRLRLARSKKTGASKGYAFIEFKVPEVAKIVAETMDKYLMGKRLLKAQYIAPEERRKSYFKGKNYSADNYPTKRNRAEMIKKINSKKSNEQDKKTNKQILKQINDVKQKLKAVGIEYDFKPVDVPDYLKSEIEGENLDESNDVSDSDASDDIVFNPPTKVQKTLIQKKTKPASKATSVIKKSKDVVKTKLAGVTKKTAKNTKQKQVIVKDEKKLNLIKSQINKNDQIKLKTAKTINVSKKTKVNKKTK